MLKIEISRTSGRRRRRGGSPQSPGGAPRRGVRGTARSAIALSGGRTPWKMLERLIALDVPWAGVHVFQTDEREAPDGGPRTANGHPGSPAVLGESGLPDAKPAPHAGGRAGNSTRLATRTHKPLPGMAVAAGSISCTSGSAKDGHTASLVPGDRALGVADRDVTVAGPYQGRWRMTLTRPAIDRATERIWVVTGGREGDDCSARLCAGDETIPAGRVYPGRLHRLRRRGGGPRISMDHESGPRIAPNMKGMKGAARC